MREYMARRYEARRIRIIADLGGACVRCGSDDRLEIDHVDRHRKGFDICRRLAGVAEPKLARELRKCQLLCRNCHEVKTVEERGHEMRSPRLLAHRERVDAA